MRGSFFRAFITMVSAIIIRLDRAFQKTRGIEFSIPLNAIAMFLISLLTFSPK